MNMRIATCLATHFLSLWICFLASGVSPLCLAEEGGANPPLAGHSSHGSAFNEGPRQNAYLMEGTGDVHLPISTTDPLAQRFFDQGVGQLHGFWYFEAERSFRRVASLNPGCAMAYWGLAQANIDNEDRAREFIKEAVARQYNASQRERDWINALARFLGETSEKKDKERRRKYVRDIEQLVQDDPSDVEAKAFLALQIWRNSHNGWPISSHQAVESLLQDIFQIAPNHPAHHYRIHLWDHEKPAMALPSAAQCGPAAPAIAHMWHMPGHIYSRLERYADAVRQQEASARVDHAHMIQDRVLPDQIHNYAHNNEWLIRNLNYLGRTRAAVALAKNMVELPRHPRYNSFSHDGMCSAKYGRRRLVETLLRYEMWQDVVELGDTPYLPPTEIPEEQIRRIHALGIAHFQLGDAEQGRQMLADLECRLAKLEAEEKASSEGEDAASESETGEDASTPSGQESDQEPNKDDDEEQKAKAEKKKREQLRKTLNKASGELRVLSALSNGCSEQALVELEKLDELNKVRKAQYFLAADSQEKALEIARETVKSAKNQVAPLAALVDLLEQAGRPDEARQCFEKLRTVAAHADLESPPLARLRDFAEAGGYPEDWRIVPPIAEDLGPPIDLPELGPFRWHPPQATSWTLRDTEGNTMSLKEYEGRPVLLIFYLGFGCLHCVEQLHLFAEEVAEFEELGVSLVAISTDSQDDLLRTVENYSSDKEFTIPLLSNASLDAFRAYRAYDDFEQVPLHGTFLIDAHGDVRWQDISYDPFTDVKFLLEETRRVLAQGSVAQQPEEIAKSPRVAGAASVPSSNVNP